MTTTVIEHRQGDTFSWAGTATLPAGAAWSALCTLWPKATSAGAEPISIQATLTEIGAHTGDATKTDYVLLLHADAEATLAWATLAGQGKSARFVGAVKFYDAAVPPNEITTDVFEVALNFNLVPYVG